MSDIKEYNVDVNIVLDDDIEPKILFASINPENKTMPVGKVQTEINGNKVITHITGKMGIGRMMNTIDDVIKTAILAKKVAED